MSVAAALVLVVYITVPAYGEFASKTPNVVIIMADDLGIGDVGCFGNDTIRTPNIDRIAKQGVKLTHHLATASVCTPSRGAFLTGRYPVRMGMAPTGLMRVNLFTSSVSGLPPTENTIGELAQTQGYRTGFIGKWHLGLHCINSGDFCHHPLNQGFDSFYGLPLTNLKDFGNNEEYVVQSYIPNIDSFLLSTAILGLVVPLMLFKYGACKLCCALVFCSILIFMPGFTFVFYRSFKAMNSIIMKDFEVVEQPIEFSDITSRLVREAVNFMEDSHKLEKPFLLFVSWIQVHTFLHASRRFSGKSRHGKYGDNVEEMDWATGQLLDTLEQLGMTENTFVYFTSDHGAHREERSHDGSVAGGWNGIYKGGKAMGGMEGGIRVPAVAMMPGLIRPGSEINLPTSHMDIFPTISSLLGVPSDPSIDGVNLLPWLQGDKSEDVPHEFLFHYCGTDIHAARFTPRNESSVWKAHYVTPVWIPGTQQCSFLCGCYGKRVQQHNPPLLYELTSDPSETIPLDHRTPHHSWVLAQLDKAMQEHISSVAPVESQFDLLKLLPRPWLQPCCNWPYCKCREEN